ncbi:hypothetical protein O9H85_08245 [Paenibacillus filicis]|uniref:Spore coat protein n=1 Tax=Paenibacillus gyeongsangnamensis TaxID=3388067 RepID=A0ABT4Q6B9_9BACL|nr:hypothetical protein [Paenibacillus filicis]MCZ8512423.1 hypothetical protein [Paenibacillus filicis]
MIEKMDVIRMRIPFPEIDAELAQKPHMYVCIENGNNKEFLKCQTSKPKHKLKKNPPFRYVEEIPDQSRNPFINPTLIDCDKSFYVENVRVSLDLLTSPRNVCTDVFTDVLAEIQHSDFTKNQLDSSLLSSLNWKIKQVNTN